MCILHKMKFFIILKRYLLVRRFDIFVLNYYMCINHYSLVCLHVCICTSTSNCLSPQRKFKVKIYIIIFTRETTYWFGTLNLTPFWREEESGESILSLCGLKNFSYQYICIYIYECTGYYNPGEIPNTEYSCTYINKTSS